MKDLFHEITYDFNEIDVTMDKGMNQQTKKVYIFNQEKRCILCIANEHDYLGDGTIIHEEELRVGKQYTFLKGEAQSYGSMVHLEELPCKYGYQSYLFEELRFYDVQILEKEYSNWLKEKLDESKRFMKEEECMSRELMEAMPVEEILSIEDDL